MTSKLEQSQSIQVALHELFDHFHPVNLGIAQSCRNLVLQLNRQTRPKSTWGWEYVHQVLRGQIDPSRRLSQAILKLHQKIFNKSEPYLQTISILAPVGFIPQKTIVMIRARQCAL